MTRVILTALILVVSAGLVYVTIKGAQKGSPSRVFALLGALWIAGVAALLVAAAHTRKDYAGVFAAAIAGATAILAAGIAARTAADRQKEQLEAEKARHDATLASDRALKDREDLRDAVQDAMRARDVAFRAYRWNDGRDSDEARRLRREAVAALRKAHNRLRIRHVELADAWRETYLQYVDGFTLRGPEVESAVDDDDELYDAFVALAAPITQSQLP